MILDTGCSRTLVRSDLVGMQNLKLGETITVQRVHGTYPLASVGIEVQGRALTVEVVVSETLPSFKSSQTKKLQTEQVKVREVSPVMAPEGVMQGPRIP